MASLTTETRNGKDVYRIEFLFGGKRRKIGLRGLNQKSRSVVKTKIEFLINCQANDESVPTHVTDWLRAQDDWLVDSLAKAGLIQPRRTDTLIDFFDAYIAANKSKHGIDWEKNQNGTRNVAERYFESRTIHDITAVDATSFREWMATEGKLVGTEKKKNRQAVPYSEATISGHVKIMRLIFKAAVKKNIVVSNPFADVVAGSQSNSARAFEVTADVIERVIDAAPNAQWRLLIALVRFGGLRTGSETRALKWSHVDFMEGTIRVPGAKAKKRNKDGTRKIRWRTIPIYPELRPFLEDCFTPEAIFCLDEIKGTDAYLYRVFKKLVVKAELEPWERLWHNLRATRDSELSAMGLSDSAVAELMGNSPEVSRKHYKFITNETLEMLKSQVVQKVVQQVPEEGVLGGTGRNTIRVFPGIHVDPEKLKDNQYTPLDSNQ